MFCYKCGHELEDGALFCEACGAKQDNAEQGKQPPEKENVISQESGASQHNTADNGNNNPKKKLSKKWIIIIAEAVVALGLVIAFFAVNIHKSNYKVVAENYTNACIMGNAGKVYDTIYLPDSKMLTKESFIRQNSDLLNQSDPGLAQAVKAEAMDSNEQDGKAIAQVRTFASSGNYNYSSVELVREDKNRFLFFPSWKVDSTNYVENNVKVAADPSIKVYIDDMEVPEEYRTKDKTSYEIPALFKGNHSYVFKSDDFTTLPVVDPVYLKDSASKSSQIYYSEEDQKKIIESAFSLVQDAVNAHLTGKSFDSIESMFAKRFMSTNKKLYDDVSEYYYAKTNPLGVGITEVSMKNVEGSIYKSAIYEGRITASVTLDMVVSNKGVSRGYNIMSRGGNITNNEPLIEGVDANNKTQQTVVIEYEDGHWVISVLDLGAIEGCYKFDPNATLTP